ncbi:MAG TPA: DNA repair protein RadC [Candidatus Acidoferrum sp.]|nr:DNA repair protein RadC [Candidatus Acidoferrum sp.]
MPNYRRINQMPAIDRPREKLQRKGPSALSDFELLEVVVGSGNKQSSVSQIAWQIQKLLQKDADNITFESLTKLNGVSIAQASKILAALELAKRHLVRDIEPVLTQSDIIARLSDIRHKQQEHFVCLSLDGGQRLISQRTVAIGILDSVIAHPREVFSDAIVDRAASILVAHNHPSGNAQPSDKDIQLTQQLVAAGQLLGIPLRDHVVVSKNDYFSFRQHHLL